MIRNFYEKHNPKVFASLLTHVGQLAYDNNCWVRLRKVWYTPLEFSEKYRHSNPVNYAEAEILNPMEAMRSGLNVFTDKIIKEGYQERHDQIKQVPWRGQM